jgi:hypothetical protein
VGSIPPPPTISFIPQHLFLRLTPIESIHRKLFNSSRTVFNRFTLLIAYHVRVEAQRDPGGTIPQLLLHDCGRCPVFKQTAGGTVPHGMKAAPCYSQFREKWV